MFADVQTLLENSWPKPRAGWIGYAIAAAVLGLFAAGAAADRTGRAQQAVETLASILMILLLAGMAIINYFQAHARRIEQAHLETAEELVQLRRWPQAATLLQSMLARPTRTPVARLQALVYLSSVLGRFNRFDDVSIIADHLLESIPLEAPAVHMVKLARGVALLRQERLFDADRAIADLRRSPQASDSAGLVLLELYRDVKTGHPTEAIDLFQKKRDLISRQLGHRVADAYLLAAMAYDMLNQTAQAQAAYESATLLSPALELHRRYPETSPLAARYKQAAPPAEVAG